MKYRLVLTKASGEQQIVERVGFKAINAVLDLIREVPVYSEWVLYRVNRRTPDLRSPATELVEIVEASDNWLPF